MDNYEKYQHYKKKYLELKNQMRDQRGGVAPLSKMSQPKEYKGYGHFPIVDEIYFWGRQMAEHLLFLQLGFEDFDDKLELKNAAGELREAWEKFFEQTYYNNGIKPDLNTVFLDNQDLSKIKFFDQVKLNDLLAKTIKFKENAIQILDSGKWIGWIFPALAKHMLKEAQYFQGILEGPALGVQQEISFINEHHSEETGATAQLIDPSPDQQKIIDLVRSYSLKNMSKFLAGQSLSGDGVPPNGPFPQPWTKEEEAILKGIDPAELQTLLELSFRYSDELTRFADDTGKKLEANQLKSIIHPVLAKHVYREFARFTQTLKMLQQSTNINNVNNVNNVNNLNKINKFY